MLVAACNECPCGRPRADCKCTDPERARYHRRLSGPLLDRIDLICLVERSARASELVRRDEPLGATARRRSASVSSRRASARRRASPARPRCCNAAMDGPATRRVVRVPAAAQAPPARRAARPRDSAAARTTACCGSPARSPTSTGANDVTVDDVDEALGYKLSRPRSWQPHDPRLRHLPRAGAPDRGAGAADRAARGPRASARPRRCSRCPTRSCSGRRPDAARADARSATARGGRRRADATRAARRRRGLRPRRPLSRSACASSHDAPRALFHTGPLERAGASCARARRSRSSARARPSDARARGRLRARAAASRRPG